MNTFKIFILMAALTALLVWIGRYVGGTNGMIMAFGFALLMNGVSYWYSDKIVLTMYRAKPVSSSEAPGLHDMVRQLTVQAGIPMPKLYVVPSMMPNAFATGRNPEHAAVAVTEGLMRVLERDEVEGVIAHELAHVKNRDVLISTIAATLAGAISMLAYMLRFAAIFGGGRSSDDDNGGILGLLAVAIVAPIVAMLIQFAVSRSREYQADATGAKLSSKPMNLASALLKLEKASKQIPSEATPATAHMFIVNPLRGAGLWSLLSTHPSTEDRVRRLEAMSHNTN